MRKFFMSGMLLFAAFILQSAEFGTKWNIRVLPKNAECPVVSNGKTDAIGKKIEASSTKKRVSFDLEKLAGIKPDGSRFSVVEGTLRASGNTTILLGIGADYFYELYVNGKLVSSTMQGGNSADGKWITPDNQIQIVQLKKGDNPVLLLVRSGSSGYKLEMAEKKLTPENLRKSMLLTESSIPLNKIIAGPVMTVPEKNTVHIVFESAKYAYAELEYRILPGNGKWTKSFSAEPDAGVIPGRVKVHRFALTGLVPEKEYEFRTLLRMPGDMAHSAEGPSGKFTAPGISDKPFAFFATNDTQFSPPITKKYMESYRKVCRTDDCAMLVHLGDMISLTRSFSDNYFIPYIDVLNGKLPRLRPVVMIRGNHEFRGEMAAEWLNYFSSSERTGYYGFRHGKVCFIVLDTGEDKDYRNRPEKPLFRGEKAYMKRQRAWLENYVKSDEFKTAEFRIVLSHAYPLLSEGYMTQSVRDLAGGLFFGKNPMHKIHLWMAGHTHSYQRTFPGKNKTLALREQFFTKTLPEEVPFTIVVGDGPSKAPQTCGFRVECGKSILAEVRLPDGTLFDRFEIDQQGNIVKSEPSKNLREYKFPQKNRNKSRR